MDASGRWVGPGIRLVSGSRRWSRLLPGCTPRRLVVGAGVRRGPTRHRSSGGHAARPSHRTAANAAPSARRRRHRRHPRRVAWPGWCRAPCVGVRGNRAAGCGGWCGGCRYDNARPCERSCDRCSGSCWSCRHRGSAQYARRPGCEAGSLRRHLKVRLRSERGRSLTPLKPQPRRVVTGDVEEILENRQWLLSTLPKPHVRKMSG